MTDLDSPLLDALFATRLQIRALWEGPGPIPAEAWALLRDINQLIDTYYARHSNMPSHMRPKVQPLTNGGAR